jgi:pyruvate/2-oxoglutarate dehydrogenase complex dihydrolipoamide acyltransferase (E2) component
MNSKAGALNDSIEAPGDSRVVRLPRSQGQITDWLNIAGRRHTMHALLELDVTDVRQAIRKQRARTGGPLSFTAFLVACLARAIAEDKRMHAASRGRRDLVLFNDVDVTVAVETDVEGVKIPVPHIIRAANRKSPAEISREIRRGATGPEPYQAARRLLPLWLLVPGVARQFVWSRLLADPVRRKRLTGTTFVAALGMFGRGTAWGLPQAANYTLGMTVGGLARKPGVTRTGGAERIEVREFLCLTLSFDHDLIDGGPAARFAARLAELVETGSGLEEREASDRALASPAGTGRAGP